MNSQRLKIVVVGAGPTGLTLAAAVAQRGHRVVAVDRDAGPGADGSWRRRGVMQFDLAHAFRPQVRDLLLAEWPAAWRAWEQLGADVMEGPVRGVRSRRSTYEVALRRAARAVDGLTVATGRVERLLERGGRVVGVSVDGSPVEADLVIDAGGRSSRRATAPVPHLAADTGIAYANRTYRRAPGADPGPMSGPVAWFGHFDRYQAYVFPHERGHLSAVIVRPATDRRMARLRDPAAFDAAASAIPGLADWIDPAVAHPTSAVRTGNRLRNEYRLQDHRPGVVAIGDAVATTTPTAGRGVALASLQIAALLRMLDDGADPASISEPFGAWCDASIRPWVEDHLAVDGQLVRRWHGDGLDLARPLTSADIVAAAAADARIEGHLAGFLDMTALPDSLAPAEPLARAVYETGWRPALSPGPSRDELVERMERAVLVPTSTGRTPEEHPCPSRP